MNNLEKFNIEDNTVVEDSKKSKKFNKKIIIFLIVFILLIGGLYYSYTETNYLKFFKDIFVEKKQIIEEKIEPILNEVKYELGSELKNDKTLYVKNYSELNELEIDLENISTNQNNLVDEIGEFSYTVEYNNKTYTGKIIVEDTTPPNALTKVAYISQGDLELKPELFLRNITDNSNKYEAEIVNLEEIDTSILGEKDIQIIIKDTNGNERELESKLVVLDLSFASMFGMQDLNVSYNDKNDLEWDKTITEKFSSAIYDSSNIYVEAIEKITSYNWTEKVSSLYPGATINSEDILILYNQNNLIVGITKRVNILYNNENKSYYLTY